MGFARKIIWFASLCCLAFITAAPQGPRNGETGAIYAAELLAVDAEAPTNTTESPEKIESYNAYYVAFGVFSGLAIVSVCVAIYTDCRSRRMRRIMSSYQEIQGQVTTEPEHTTTRFQPSPKLLHRAEEPSQAQRDALAQNIIDLHAEDSAPDVPVQKAVEVHRSESSTSQAQLEASPESLLDLSEPEPPEYDDIAKAPRQTQEGNMLEPSTVETIQKLVESLENYEPEPQKQGSPPRDLRHEIGEPETAQDLLHPEPEPQSAQWPPEDLLHRMVEPETPAVHSPPKDLLHELEEELPLAQSPAVDEVDASETQLTRSTEENLLQDIVASVGPETSKVSHEAP